MNRTRRFAPAILILAACAALVLGEAALAAAPAPFAAGSAAVSEPTVSLEFRGADVRDVLGALAKLTGTNIIADQAVQGPISVTLNEVPFSQALDLIVKANGYAYRWVGNIVLVGQGDKLDEAVEAPQVEVFALKHAKAQDVMKPLSLVVPAANMTVNDRTQTLVVKGTPTVLASARQLLRLLDVPEAAPPAPPAVAAPPAETAAPPASSPAPPPPPQPVQVKVYELKYAQSDDVKAALGLVLSKEAVSVGRKDRSVVVTGTEELLQRADEVVARLDVPTRQVVIDTRIEEISATANRKLGLQWNFPLTLVKDPLDPSVVTKVVSDFTATLSALEEDGEATVLANPRIVALDGKEASIHIGDRIPLVINRQVTEGGVTSTVQEVQFIDAGIILKVTPRFNDDQTITVHVNPEVSTIAGQTQQGYPSIRTRSASTTMILRAGETVALGGLLSQNEVDTLRKTPLLGDLPLVGNLFQTKIKDKRQTEIVIFLTPQVGPVPTIGG